jgi:glycerophosphoryl diester phosphodiesterase
MIILTHRGLEHSNENFYPESSYESFENQLSRGFGIEFDVNFAKDGIIIFHDSDLNRITNGEDKRLFSELSLSELKEIKFGKNKKGRFATFDEVLELIRKNKSEINALHLKGKYQTERELDILIKVLIKNKDILNKIIIFDVKPEAAEYLKSKIKELHLAPSVAHDYDILRYNSCVGNTLISIEDAIKYKKQGIYNWVWMDEWDTIDENGKEKKFYTKENFERLRKEGYKIALVTPELHTTSPGLYGGESHKDAKTKESLFKRIKEIISIKPDALCTDHPEEVRNFVV